MRTVKSSSLSVAGALLLLLMTLALVVSLLAAKPAHAKTFTVNYTGDGPDAVPGNGSCNVVFGLCSLRAAIQETNANATVDTINFNIPNDPNIPGNEVKSIKPTKALPTIDEPVTINGYSQPGSSPNTLAQGNNAVLKIELDGDKAPENADGLLLDGSASDNSVIKGLVINDFDGDGVVLVNTSESKVQGNFIGTDPSGTLDRGNADGGVLSFGEGNLIGGTTPQARNIISGNNGDGIALYDSDHKVLGNYIGTTKSGTGNLGNSDWGVSIHRGGVVPPPSKHTVGNNTAAGANTIAFNGRDGVAVLQCGNCPFSTGNRILRNSIFENGKLGINLMPIVPSDSVTQNDLKDPDGGPNNLQNYPWLTAATIFSGETTIKGKLNSKPNQTFTLRFFSSPVADSSGFGEGKKFLGTKSVTTDANGNVLAFAFQPAQAVPAGQVVTATATDPEGNTSEFSEALEVVVP